MRARRVRAPTPDFSGRNTTSPRRPTSSEKSGCGALCAHDIRPHRPPPRRHLSRGQRSA
ncbi:hypothetical protein ACFPRL_24735 [Pseudoclavibacter helvolus]